MADGTQQYGLGRFQGGPSKSSLAYIDMLSGAGKQVSGAARQSMEARAEISRREAEATSKVGIADPSKLGSTLSGALRSDAEELKRLIGGQGETAYDFSNLNDIARFASDVEAFNAKIVAAEASHAMTIGTAEDTPDKSTYHGMYERAKLAQASGGDVAEGFVYENLAGEGDFFDANATMESVENVDALMNGNVSKRDGKYVVTSPTGVEQVFESIDDIMKAQQEAVLPNYTRVKEVSGADVVEDKKWGMNAFDTEAKAESAFVQYVLDNPAQAKRRFNTRTGAKDVVLGASQDPRAAELRAKYGLGNDVMNDAQLEFLEEMMERWRVSVREEEEKQGTPTASQNRLQEFSGRITANFQFAGAGPSTSTDDEGNAIPGESREFGGTRGIYLNNQTILVGPGEEAQSLVGLYRTNNDTYEYVYRDNKGATHSQEFKIAKNRDGEPIDAHVGKLAAALGMTSNDVITLVRKLRD